MLETVNNRGSEGVAVYGISILGKFPESVGWLSAVVEFGQIYGNVCAIVSHFGKHICIRRYNNERTIFIV